MDAQPTERDMRRIGLIRIGKGFAQGLLLYLLSEAHEHKFWPWGQPELFAALVAIALFVPLVVIAGLSGFRWRTLILWTLGAAAITAALAGYEVWRNLGDPASVTPGDWSLPFAVAPVIAAVLFIGNHLLEASEIDRRFVAAYPNYFEPAWKHGVQGVLSLLFTAVFWGLLGLGAALFTLIHISLLADIIAKPWFYFPATGMAFAAAVHLTDVRPAVVRGVRTVALTLLAWLTPLLALMAGAFVLALPFTGLQPLWQTRAAASILLNAASMLVLLLNATYQDGTEPPHPVLRWAGRAAGVILVPLVLLAAVAIGLRIQQYGLTPQRILAGAWAVIAGAYAAGYAFAAVRPGGWMKPLERTNVAAAWLILIIVALLFTPIADPARLSVADQVHRLDSGAVAPDKFDYAFLRFRGSRFGREALTALAARKGVGREADIAARAAVASKQAFPFLPGASSATPLTPQGRADLITVYPKGQALPPGFAEQDWPSQSNSPDCLTGSTRTRCEAFLLDLDGDGVAEVLIAATSQVYAPIAVMKQGADGHWTTVGSIPTYGCATIFDPLRAGRFETVSPSPPWRDLTLDGMRLSVVPPPERFSCSKPISGKPPPPAPATRSAR